MGSLIGACAFAFLGAFLCSLHAIGVAQERKKREQALESLGPRGQPEEPAASPAWSSRLLAAMASCSAEGEAGKPRILRWRLWSWGTGGIPKLVLESGREGSISVQGFCRARARCVLACSAGGALVGCVLSTELMALGLAVGAMLGWAAPRRALERERAERAFSMEEELCRMIEVVVLGLKSGLSFDKALDLYTGAFDGGLSASLKAARNQWAHGLATRADGLRRVAASYDSPVLGRLMECVIRSQRFGTSLSSALVLEEEEIRAARKAAVEERIAKAPVKMLVPVTALILPAMLLMVLGPIALNLANGF